jgi:hypothetical protein
MAQQSRYLCADLMRLGNVVIALGTEAVGVDHRQRDGCVWGREFADVTG